MTFVIAEAGVNHGGKLREALKLVDAAKWAGADAVKFQMFDSVKLWGDTRIQALELSQQQMRDVAAHCDSVGIEFMCTPFGVEEVEFLAPLVKRMKIASGCIANISLVEAAGNSGLSVILSTGMSTMEEIRRATDVLEDDTTLLHCTSSYPCRLEDVNLYAMNSLRMLGFDVGYSDHTNGITVAIAAAALGATVIEKHLTLDRNAEGPDHAASITPREFRAMRMAIGEVEAALGDGVKRVMASEVALRKAWRGV